MSTGTTCETRLPRLCKSLTVPSLRRAGKEQVLEEVTARYTKGVKDPIV